MVVKALAVTGGTAMGGGTDYTLAKAINSPVAGTALQPSVVSGIYYLGMSYDNLTEGGSWFDESTTPDPGFRWSESGSQWIWNMSTNGLPPRQTHWFRIVLIDGSSMYFNVMTR
ncbi:MAG TPA: hypothetical protein VFU31_13110 [Candidatus Binatia bacterium]|nr:hypothetical protein [Candidatus Binatia bacterium]